MNSMFWLLSPTPPFLLPFFRYFRLHAVCMGGEKKMKRTRRRKKQNKSNYFIRVVIYFKCTKDVRMMRWKNRERFFFTSFFRNFFLLQSTMMLSMYCCYPRPHTCLAFTWCAKSTTAWIIISSVNEGRVWKEKNHDHIPRDCVLENPMFSK